MESKTSKILCILLIFSFISCSALIINPVKATVPLDINGVDDVFNGGAPLPYTSYYDWSTAMDNYIATLKANGGTNLNYLMVSNDAAISYLGGFYTLASNGGSGKMDPSYYGGINIGHTVDSLLHDLGVKLHAQGMTLTIQAMTLSGSTQTTALEGNTGNKDSWIAGLVRIVNDVNPDYVDVLSEPENSWSATELIAFYVQAATAIKAADSSVIIGVSSNPWWYSDSTHNANYFLDQACSGSTGKWINLPSDTIFITHSGYYMYNNVYTVGSDPSWWNEYITGSYAGAKSDMIAIQLTPCGIQDALNRGIYVLIENVGTNENPYSGELSNQADKIQFLTDISSWAKQNGIGWTTSGAGMDLTGEPDSWVFASTTTLNAFGYALLTVPLIINASPTPTPSPSPTPTASPIPNTQDSSLVSSPDTTIFWFGAFIVFLIASAVIAIAFFPIFGIFAGILGLIGTWWFYQAGTIIINSVTDPSTNITTTAYMPLGWLILVPIVLCVFNFMTPAIKR